MPKDAKFWLSRIRGIAQAPLRIMNVCGGHERSITMAGLRQVLPKNIELIPGPGCPVCVCPEEDIYQAIQLCRNENIILVAFGDMLRVPVNVPRNQPRTLEQARAAGADVRAIASPTEAVRIASDNPQQEVIFFVAGFETTTAPVAAMILEQIPSNLFLLISARLTWPAVSRLLSSERPGFDCLIAPGHVSTVMGAEEWEFVVNKHAIPTAIAGFTPESLLAAFYSVIRQQLEQQIFLDNCYSELVHKNANPTAKKQLATVFDIVDCVWRGIGIIPASGFALNQKYAALDARQRYPDYTDMARKHAGEMPPGCDCAQVVLGKIYPNQCRLYGKACTPRQPVGPCMVSDEGACRIWWAGGYHSPS
ncbi:MAG: hydrogenase formation protein HypD [Pseudomonadota bacterium]